MGHFKSKEKCNLKTLPEFQIIKSNDVKRLIFLKWNKIILVLQIKVKIADLEIVNDFGNLVSRENQSDMELLSKNHTF